LPCSHPARYALRAICDVLPRHDPAARLCRPKLQARMRRLKERGASRPHSENRRAELGGRKWRKRPAEPPRRGEKRRGHGRPDRERQRTANVWRAELRVSPNFRCAAPSEVSRASRLTSNGLRLQAGRPRYFPEARESTRIRANGGRPGWLRRSVGNWCRITYEN